MASKTNVTINGNNYFQIRRKVGMKKNKAGNWVADYRLFYGKSKKEALEKYAAFMKRDHPDAQKPLGEWADWYIENSFKPSSAYKDGTKVLYINAYKSVFGNSDLSGRSVSELTGAELQQVINSASCKASTVHGAVKLLRLLFKYLEVQKINTDITRGLVLPAIDKKRQDQDIETFTDAELKKFIRDTPKAHRLRLLVILAINTGARIGELLALTYDDISADQIRINKSLIELDRINGDNDSERRAEISGTKTPSSVRSVPINESVAQAVDDHKKWHFAEMEKNGYKTDYVFTDSNGSLYYKSSVRSAFSRLCRSLQIEPRGFHTFRHTFGSRLAAAGVPIQTVSKLMGHSSITVTAKYYINVSTDEKKQAIAALKLS